MIKFDSCFVQAKMKNTEVSSQETRCDIVDTLTNALSGNSSKL